MQSAYKSIEAADYCRCTVKFIRKAATLAGKKKLGRSFVFTQRELDHLIENGHLPGFKELEVCTRSTSEKIVSIGKSTSMLPESERYAKALELPTK